MVVQWWWYSGGGGVELQRWWYSGGCGAERERDGNGREREAVVVQWWCVVGQRDGGGTVVVRCGAEWRWWYSGGCGDYETERERSEREGENLD